MSRHVRTDLDGPVATIARGVLRRPALRIIDDVSQRGAGLGGEPAETLLPAVPTGIPTAARTGTYFRLLGPFEVVRDGHVIDSGRRIQRLILAVLLLEANRVVAVDRLVGLAWPYAPPRSARGSVQAYVSRARSVLRACSAGDASLERVGSGYRLTVDEMRVDAHRFAALVSQARAAEDAVALPLLDEALALWRGRPLVDLEEEGASERLCASLCELREAAVEGRAEAALRLGRHDELIPDLGAAVAEFPLRERLVELQMLALYRAGRRSDALGAFTGIRHRLAEDLGLDPGPDLIRLQHAVLRDDPALQATLQAGTVPAPRAAATVGRTEPRRYNGVVPGTRQGGPRPADTPGPHRPLAELPPDVADFTGRAGEVDEILRLHTAQESGPRPAIPVTVIAGKAGVGKSTLAVHVAHQLRPHFPDGQLYADLRDAGGDPADPAEVLDRFLGALGGDPAAIRDSLEARAAAFRSLLAGRRVLVVLDNAASTAQLRSLLPGAPTCAVLVTSRRPLSELPGSRLVRLDVLNLDESARLLLRLVAPHQADCDSHDGGRSGACRIAELCGGLPLALRVAGARLAAKPHWSLADLVERLADESRRLDELVHGKLDVRASLALSYQELDQAERALFCRLTRLDIPEIPAHAAGGSLRDAERLLERLVDAQLIDAAGRGPDGQHRYRFHDLIKLYGRERDRQPEA
jgi:DNA-binding SARP family transcriptional activator